LGAKDKTISASKGTELQGSDNAVNMNSSGVDEVLTTTATKCTGPLAQWQLINALC
jgi:hypothetical protein